MRRIGAVATAIVLLCVAGIALAQFSIEGQVRGILDGLVAKPPPPWTSFKYRDVSFNIADRKLIVTGLEFRGTDDKPHDLTIERIELVDFNPAVIEKMANPSLYREGKGDGAFARVASDGLIVGVRSNRDGERFSLTELRLHEVSARQFAEAPTAGAFSKETPSKSIALVLAAFQAGSVVASGMEGSNSKGEGARFTKVAFSEFDSGRFGEISLQGVRGVASDLETFSIDTISLRGLDLRAALPDMLSGKSISYNDPARKPNFDELRVQGVGGKALEAQGFRMSEIVSTATRSSDRQTEKFAFKVSGVELRPGTAPDSMTTQALQLLRYDSLPMELVCDAGNDYAAKVSWVDKCDLKSAGAATLSFKYRLGGVRDDAIGEDPQAMAAAIQQMQLVSLQISVRDQSLMERILTAAASLEGKAMPQKRQEIVLQIQQGSAGFTQGSARLQQAVQAIVGFVNKPDVLTLELMPKAPVRFSEFNAGMAADPPAAAEKLGLSVRNGP